MTEVTAELLQQLEARGPALGARVLAAMYRNPFWLDRFGERGRKHAQTGGNYHLTYLVSALSASDVHVLTRYATWLRTVLVTRGMCTLHLSENFERLAQAIAEEVPASEACGEYLREAQRALLYQEGIAGELEQQREAIVAAALQAAATGALAAHTAEQRASCEEDVRYHLAYLTDAAALDRPDLFTSYAAWAAGFFERRGHPLEHLLHAFDALGTGIDAYTPSDAGRSFAQTCLRTGGEAARGAASGTASQGSHGP